MREPLGDISGVFSTNPAAREAFLNSLGTTNGGADGGCACPTMQVLRLGLKPFSSRVIPLFHNLFEYLLSNSLT